MDALGHGQIIVDTLTHESNKTQFTFYLGKFYSLFFDPAQWWWLEHILFLAYLSRLGRLRSLSGLSSLSLLQQSGRTLFPLYSLLGGMTIHTNSWRGKKLFSYNLSNVVPYFWILSGHLTSICG